MKKAVIIYGSTHHGNTYKLVEAISKQFQVDVVNATKTQEMNLDSYDLIGIASGIDFGKFYPTVEDFAKKNLPNGKKVFFLYTCAMVKDDFSNSIREICESKECEMIGQYGCKGFNTYGPWKIIGGMNKSHPNAKEIQAAVDFYGNIKKVIDK